MKRQNKVCYKCGKPATSREHVPPACLFPEEKDIKTSIFRNNLITVPSCEEHNSKKSANDEFLMSCLAGIVGNNKVGLFHALTKVKRAIERKSSSIGDLLLPEMPTSPQQYKDGRVATLQVNKVNQHRLHSCFEHVAYGLFYHKFGKIFDGECGILLDFITYEDNRMETYKLLCRKRWEIDPYNPVKEGANPEIFRFEFQPPDHLGLIGLKLTFYEGASVFVAFIPKSNLPFHTLHGSLIDAGIPTIVRFPDGSEFQFNNRE